MANFGRNAPPIAVVLASLLLWVSFAWGLPAEPAAEGEADVAPAEGAWKCDRCGTASDASAKYCMECGAKKAGEAEVAPGDPWAGVRISDAYDYAECPQCWNRNDVRAERCTDCGNVLPQPSGQYTYPPWIFVPGKGFYREGTVVEPAKKRKGFIITGYVLIAVAGAAMIVGATGGGPGLIFGGIVVGSVGGVGGVFLIVGYATRRGPVYALNPGQLYENGPSYTYARRSPGSEGVGLKIEFTLLSF